MKKRIKFDNGNKSNKVNKYYRNSNSSNNNNNDDDNSILKQEYNQS